MKTNTKPPRAELATRAEQELRRAVLCCLLWEDTHYEDGASIAERISALVHQVPGAVVAALAVEAREDMKLRHVPLMLVREMARIDTHKPYVAWALERVIQRPDELSEFCAIYWKDGRQPLSAQVKKGLARAFKKFNEYSMAKYNGGDGKVKLRDVAFLAHPSAWDGGGNVTSKRRQYPDGAKKILHRHPDSTLGKLVEGTLETPDTWEAALSAGKDKKATWERLISEGKLGAMALLRNLRNMAEAGVPKDIVSAAIANADITRVLPYRFIAAARFAPDLEPVLETCMLKAVEGSKRLKGRTIILVDVSYSMQKLVSVKSDLTRLDAACGLAILAREVCQDAAVYTFSERLVKVPPRRGFALRDAVVGSQPHHNTYLGRAISELKSSETFDRIIVITDEQSADAVGGPAAIGYMVNVSSEEHGVGFGDWTRVTGWSESVLAFIDSMESDGSDRRRIDVPEPAAKQPPKGTFCGLDPANGKDFGVLQKGEHFIVMSTVSAKNAPKKVLAKFSRLTAKKKGTAKIVAKKAATGKLTAKKKSAKKVFKRK